jgi:hypothetical protein
VSQVFITARVDQLRLLLRDRLLGMPRELDAAGDAGGVHVDMAVGQRARDDRIEVSRIPLGRHDTLPASGRAPLVEGELGGAPVELVDQPLRRRRHLVHGAIREVDDLLRMTESEPGAGTVGRRVAFRRGIRLTRALEAVPAPGQSTGL